MRVLKSAANGTGGGFFTRIAPFWRWLPWRSYVVSQNADYSLGAQAREIGCIASLGLLAALLVAGGWEIYCLSTETVTASNFDRITPGMTMAEVEAILGTEHTEYGDYSRFPRIPDLTRVLWTDQGRFSNFVCKFTIAVYFKDGKVDSKRVLPCARLS